MNEIELKGKRHLMRIDLGMIDFTDVEYDIVDSIAQQACKQISKLSPIRDEVYIDYGEYWYGICYGINWDGLNAFMDVKLTYFNDDEYKVKIIITDKPEIRRTRSLFSQETIIYPRDTGLLQFINWEFK